MVVRCLRGVDVYIRGASEGNGARNCYGRYIIYNNMAWLLDHRAVCLGQFLECKYSSATEITDSLSFEASP